MIPAVRDLRNRIASLLQQRMNIVRSERKVIDQLTLLKSALMSVLLTGEVRVTPDEDAA